MRERQTDILTKKERVVGLDRRCVQHARKLGDVFVREELRVVLVEEPRCREDFESLMTIELQNVANAVQHFSTDPAVARFQPAERAVVDLCQTGDLLLRHATVVPEARQ